MEISEVNPDGNVYQLKDATARTQISQIKEQNVYSTEEADTGKTWIDGKTIYRKIFTGRFTASANVTVNIVSSANMPDIDTLVGYSGFYSTDATNYSTLGDSSTRVFFGLGTSSKRIALQSEIARTNQKFIITLEYTKA